MFSNRFALAALAAACIAAAGVGGYLATRNASTVAPQVSANATPTAAAPATAVAPALKPAASETAAETTPAKPIENPAEPEKGIEKTKGKSEKEKSVASRVADRAPKHSDRAVMQQATAAAQQEAGTTPQQIAAPPPAVPDVPAPKAEDRPAQDQRPAEPPAKTYEELVVSSESVIGLQTDRTISSETAHVEDRVDARVTRDVRVGMRVAIPAGARLIGSVTEVDKGGKFKERARLGIRFNTLIMPDNTRIAISTETIYRDGEPPTAAPKVGGGAAVGAILGAILGGAKGAAVGGAVGAGAGATAAATADRNAATLPAGTQTTVRIIQPVTVIVER